MFTLRDVGLIILVEFEFKLYQFQSVEEACERPETLLLHFPAYKKLLSEHVFICTEE